MNSYVSKQPRAKIKETLLWSQLQDCKWRENCPCTITCELWPEGGNLSSLLCLKALKGLSKYSIVPLNLSSNMLYKQHLSSQKIEGPLFRKVCVEENGGRWLTVHRTGKKRGQIKVEAWTSETFIFLFPLRAKGSYSSPEIVKCYFSFPFLEAQGNLQSHGYSSLVTILFQNWALFRCCEPFRPPGILPVNCMSPASARVKWLKKLFLQCVVSLLYQP